MQLIDVVEALGVPRASLLAVASLSAGFAPDSASAHARMPMADLLRLCDAARDVSHCPALGLEFALRVRPATFSVLGYALMTCSTLGEAIALLPHYRRLVFDVGYSETAFATEGEEARLSWHVLADSGLPYSEVLAEALLASWVAFGRWIAGSSVPLREVRFHHRLGDSATRERYAAFFACPVIDGTEYNALVFDAALLQRALPQADASLHLAMREQARAALAHLQSGSQEEQISQKVRQVLVPLMPKCEASVQHVAAALHLAPRTLQRRLADAGISFQTLLDDTRKELAAVYLRDSTLSALDVALLLGYVEQSSFTRAFRNWFGCTPSNWRRRPR